MKDVWTVNLALPDDLQTKRLERPILCGFSLFVLAVMVLLFIFGETLPRKIGPPAVSILAATLALIVTYGARVEPVSKVLEDVDWRTLVFLVCLFCLVQAVQKTGILQSFSQNLYVWFGTDLLLIALILLGLVGAASSVLANIPVVAAMLLMVKGYSVTAGLVPDLALSPGFVDWPSRLIPLFVAMMFAGTLGGNATMIGASANVVSVGICVSHGKKVSFVTFMRYGLPITLCQLAASAVYVVCFFYLSGR